MFLKYINLVIILLFAHAVSDLALQTEFMGKYKSPNEKRHNVNWSIVMAAHGMVNGAVVALVTQSIALGLMETVAHALIDLGSSTKKYNHWIDQGLHLSTKLIWAFIWLKTGV